MLGVQGGCGYIIDTTGRELPMDTAREWLECFFYPIASSSSSFPATSPSYMYSSSYISSTAKPSQGADEEGARPAEKRAGREEERV